MTDDALRQFVGYGMKRAFHAIQQDVTAALQPYGLRMLTFSALAVIGQSPRLRQSALADILAIERPNLVLILDELERAELITRDRARDDRRAYELSPTIRGRRLLEKAVAAVAAHDARMTRGLSAEERAVLIRAMARIEANGRGEDDGTGDLADGRGAVSQA